MNSIQLRFVTFVMYLILIAGTFVVLELKSREVSSLRGTYAEAVSDLQEARAQLKLCSKKSHMSHGFHDMMHELSVCTESMAIARRAVTKGLEDMQSLEVCLRRAQNLYYEIVELRSECGCR